MWPVRILLNRLLRTGACTSSTTSDSDRELLFCSNLRFNIIIKLSLILCFHRYLCHWILADYFFFSLSCLLPCVIVDDSSETFTCKRNFFFFR
ncbi:hypothetical protein L873DRAFT_868932 [Choiromyces venosus 120613-1]|uniref:Uncharacterized protein n=1 Tax=Choiromyces venosus 120613-1 TaxID=1336337 RepID=A0A3N4JSY0_9PEZI|nr:hypothetical protein L873DRAFT_868932 [Choiromyces venosus 120613-1]